MEVTLDNFEEFGLTYPQNKKGEDSKRFFSLWVDKNSGTVYLNTYSYGSNTPPSKEWNQIQKYIIKRSINCTS